MCLTVPCQESLPTSSFPRGGTAQAMLDYWIARLVCRLKFNRNTCAEAKQEVVKAT